MLGALEQWAYDNASPLPQQQQALASDLAQYSQSASYENGRHLGNVVALGESAYEVIAGFGSAGGGIALCGTGALCVAGVAAVGVGTVAVANGGAIAGTAAGQELMLLAKRTGRQPTASGHTIGANGHKIDPQTLWKEDNYHLDVENFDPGQQPGRLHFQEQVGNKAYRYEYDFDAHEFRPSKQGYLPPAKLLKQWMQDPEFLKALNRGAELLGETP